jgi:sulfate adenylyltransferase subunit 1
MLGIKHVVVAINKMDLMDFSEDVFNNIVLEYAASAKELGLTNITYIPISALQGDNIVGKSLKMLWYAGEPLLHLLENVIVENEINWNDARLPVQYIIRPQTEDLHDYRGYAGKITSGVYRVGDRITVLPANIESTISAIEAGGIQVSEAFAPQSVVLQLEDDIDISRGDLIVKEGNQPTVGQELDVLLCWMDSKPLQAGGKYLLQINSRTVKSVVKEIEYKLDVNTLEKQLSPTSVGLNDVIKARIKTAYPVAPDSYKISKATGSAILIDETSHATVGACMIQ